MKNRPDRMTDPAGYIAMIHVEQECADHPVTRRILSQARGVPVKYMPAENKSTPEQEIFAKGFSAGKRHLLLGRNRGRFFKPCPGTKEYICCDYQVLNIGMNCPMDCVYCILQAYLNNPYLSFFVNIEDLLAELQADFEKNPTRFRRIGTGEFTDSLALDHLTGLSRDLVEFMGDKTSAVLELKTKTAVIDNLAGLDHGGRTVVAWSLNSPVIVAREELRTASLEERLAAAARCASWGYRLAFHFDPIIFHPGWQAGYAETVERLFAVVPRESIAWISMGCLRYIPSLKRIATRRFPNSRFFYEEFIEGLDGKARYFRTLRVEMYRFLYQQLCRHAASETCIYLCMENAAIWREVFGFSPEEEGGLPEMLDRAVGARS